MQETVILDLAVTPSSLVILLRRGNNCPTINWTDYDGKEFKNIAAPCDSLGLGAAADDKVFVATQKRVLILRGNQFEPLELGYWVTWINPNELMYYTDQDRCTWKYMLAGNSKTKIFCGEWFAGAASSDGRYITIRVLTTKDWHDVPELRILDTNSKKYIPVMQGVIPSIHWALAK